MGMFDFFRKKKLVEEGVEVETFEDAKKVFRERVEVLRKREEGVLLEIVGKFEDFYVSIEGKLGVLEGVDIESKKEYERAKVLVRQGLDKYVGLVYDLLKELRKLEKEDLVRFVDEVGKVFVGFERGSAKTYERATYLVGDEMMAVRNEIRGFYNGLLKMFDRERDLIDGLRSVREIRLKFDEVGRLEGKLREFEGEVLVNDAWVEKAEMVVGKLKGEIEMIKSSSEYISNLETKREVGVFEGELNVEIVKLKGLIDFKWLIGIVHGNSKELDVVKKYRDSFVSEFSLDDGKRLFDLLEDSGMRSDEIKGQVLLIEKMRKELNEKRDGVGVDLIVGKLGEVAKIEGEIERKRIAGVKVRGRVKEVGVRLEELKGEVVVLVGGLGFSVRT